MNSWRYRVTVHTADDILALVSEPAAEAPPKVFCDDAGACYFDAGPNPYTEAIEQLIKHIVETENLTALVVTHNPEQALRVGGEALLMVSGKLVESGQVSQIVNDPQSEQGKLYQKRQLR